MKYLSLSLPGFGKIDAPTGLPQGTPTGGLDMGAKFISALIVVAIIVAICFAVFTLVRGGINMVSSGGDKERFQSGRERVRYAIIGLIFILLSFFLLNLLGQFFGVNLLSWQG